MYYNRNVVCPVYIPGLQISDQRGISMEDQKKNRIKIDIAGTKFTVLSVEGEEYTRSVADRLNEEISTVRRSAPGLSLSSAVMLAALNLCDNLTKAQEDSDRLRVQVKEYLSEATRYRSDFEEALRENEKLRKDMETYRKHLGDKGLNSDPAPVSPAVKTVRRSSANEAEDDEFENLSFLSDKK